MSFNLLAAKAAIPSFKITIVPISDELDKSDIKVEDIFSLYDSFDELNELDNDHQKK